MRVDTLNSDQFAIFLRKSGAVGRMINAAKGKAASEFFNSTGDPNYMIWLLEFAYSSYHPIVIGARAMCAKAQYIFSQPNQRQLYDLCIQYSLGDVSKQEWLAGQKLAENILDDASIAYHQACDIYDQNSLEIFRKRNDIEEAEVLLRCFSERPFYMPTATLAVAERLRRHHNAQWPVIEPEMYQY